MSDLIFPLVLSLFQETPAVQDVSAVVAAESNLFWWCVGLLAISLALGVLEMFIPSGGIIGVGAVVCAIASIVVGFREDPLLGMAAMGAAIAATPTLFWIWVKVLPHTPVGKKIILTEGTSEEDLTRRELDRRKQEEALSSLVGARGIALTDLRPGGTIRVEGEDIEAFAEIGRITAGSNIEIVSVGGRQIRVRQVR